MNLQSQPSSVTEAPADRPAYLAVTGLTKKFGTFTALDRISLEVYDGEFVCFLGPSGCGKTTLLRAIAGLDIQTSGTIVQDGRDISALPPTERDFGIVFQSYALFPNLTVFKNIAYGLENRRTPKAEIDKRVRELLELVGLPEQAQKYPAQLSGGQQQRIALARAIATSPGLLLLDEPLSALDAKVRVHLRHEVKQLQQRLGITTIMVTHDQEEALTMADRIVVMNQGVIEQVGSPLDVYREPATAFVADFIGTMNFLPARMIAADRIGIEDFELACRPAGLKIGSAVTAAFRPEDIILTDAADRQANALELTVEEIEFLGSFVRARLIGSRLGSQHLLADISINLVRGHELSEGNRVWVRIPSERIRVFEAVNG